MQRQRRDINGATLIIFSDGKITEIVVSPTVKPISAVELVRVMTVSGVTCAKIITNQNPAVGDPGTKSPAM